MYGLILFFSDTFNFYFPKPNIQHKQSPERQLRDAVVVCTIQVDDQSLDNGGRHRKECSQLESFLVGSFNSDQELNDCENDYSSNQ